MTRVAVVVPTIRGGDLGPLLRSLADQTLPPSQVVIVDQSPHGAQAPTVGLDVSLVHRRPGAAAARNAGVAHLTDFDAVLFTDDDTCLGTGSLAAVAARMAQGVDIVSGRVTTGQTYRVDFPSRATRIDRRIVWRAAMEAGLALSRPAWLALGGFDEGLGVGAATPWQSGEGTELLLRALENGLEVWFDPAVDVQERPGDDDDPATALTKARQYARGTGRVFALRYGLGGRASLLLRSVGRLLLDLAAARRTSCALDAQILMGRLEGVTGRVFRRNQTEGAGRGRGLRPQG